MNRPSSEIAVVGAGVFGAAASLELARRGHEVTLVDPGPLPHPAASSTDISKMVRMDYGSDVFYHELAESSLVGWDRWNAEWPEPLYHETGFLVLAAGPMAPGSFEFESWRVLRDRGYDPVRTGGSSLERTCPAWRGARYPDGYVSTRGGWAESGRVVERLLALGRSAGVTLREAAATNLETAGSRVTGVELGHTSRLRTEKVVVCAGAWTPGLLPWLRGVMWATAQPVLHFGVDHPEEFRGDRFPPWAADIAGSGWYGFPALSDGRVKVAHHAQGQPADPRSPHHVTEQHATRTRDFLREAIPPLADAPIVGSRICFYCDTFDGDLWIDRDPDRDGLVVAAGGSGHAFKFAPDLGPLIADAVEGVQNRWGHRFRWRSLGAHRAEAARYQGE